MIFNKEDIDRLNNVINIVKMSRDNGIKTSMEICLSNCNAKIYHMGKDNPIIRMDFKI
jgi:hypothetical protein